MGGGDDAHVAADRRVVADALEHALLQDAQQLHLHRQAHVADLVEEQRAALGDLEATLAGGDRAGERALLVAEQLAFEQLGRDGAAVDGDEGPLAARAGVVDGAGRELLARARFAEDQHARIVGSDLADQRARLTYRRRGAGRHANVTGLFQRRLDGDAKRGSQGRVLERELQTLQPGTEGGDQLVGDGTRAISDDGDIRELLTQCSTELTPVAIRDVADQQGWRRARRLDHRAHQRAVIDEQRLEAKRP